jgi:hypothetical protein
VVFVMTVSGKAPRNMLKNTLTRRRFEIFYYAMYGQLPEVGLPLPTATPQAVDFLPAQPHPTRPPQPPTPIAPPLPLPRDQAENAPTPTKPNTAESPTGLSSAQVERGEEDAPLGQSHVDDQVDEVAAPNPLAMSQTLVAAFEQLAHPTATVVDTQIKTSEDGQVFI